MHKKLQQFSEAMSKSLACQESSNVKLTSFNQIFVTSNWFFSSCNYYFNGLDKIKCRIQLKSIGVKLTTSIICISVKPKLNWSGSDSLTTGRSSVLYESNRSWRSRFSLSPAKHAAKKKNINQNGLIWIQYENGTQDQQLSLFLLSATHVLTTRTKMLLLSYRKELYSSMLSICCFHYASFFWFVLFKFYQLKKTDVVFRSFSIIKRS